MEPILMKQINLGVNQFFKKGTKYNVIIGAGKSTLLKYFEKIGPPKMRTVKEPLDDWTNFHGTNLLDLMYKDASSWVFPFQVYSLLTLLKNHMKIVNENVKVMER